MKAHKIIILISLIVILMSTSTAAALSAHPIPASSGTSDNEDLQTPTSTDWYMAGANPQRTSWVSTEVRGDLKPLWYTPIEPYINPRVQVIATAGKLYLSTAKGLYAFNPDTGSQLWVYPTKFPIAASPTVIGATAYIGVFDRHIHAVNTANGQAIWVSDQAGAGFDTSPLVVNNQVIAGNRDGNLYAFDSATGTLLWKYKTDGPILFSAASYNGKIYFVSSDMHAYALTESGGLVWKSAALPGSGFNSWWPVVYQAPGTDRSKDRIIISGGWNYREDTNPEGNKKFTEMESADAFPASKQTSGAVISYSEIVNYYTSKPYRKTTIVLHPQTGAEMEIAPALYSWTTNGSRYPAMVGADGRIYQQAVHTYRQFIPGASLISWKPGETSFIKSDDVGYSTPADEPMYLALGGNLAYFGICCDRYAMAFDITNHAAQWSYWGYDLGSKFPGYSLYYQRPNCPGDCYGRNNISTHFGTRNGAYGIHGEGNPPIPYNGKVYLHRGNSLLAFAPPATSVIKNPKSMIVNTTSDPVQLEGETSLKTKLTTEVQEMLSAGHLRKPYLNQRKLYCISTEMEYWQNSSMTIYVLLNALPYLPTYMHSAVLQYIQNEYNSYQPYQVAIEGFGGTPRDYASTPPDALQKLNNAGNQGGTTLFTHYVSWKYAQVFGNATAVFNNIKSSLPSPPPNAALLKDPHKLNEYIAGYWGYLELQKLATGSESASIRSTLNNLIALRTNNFTNQSAYADIWETVDATSPICNQLNIASNFLYLVPELAEILRTNNLSQVQAAITEDELNAPFWFVSLTRNGLSESTLTPLYDVNAIFQAKALILQTPAAELEKYLDIPAFEKGDLFYIQNMLALLKASGASTVPVGGMDLDTTGVFRPSNGVIFLKNSNYTGFADAALNYGLPGDYPVVGDWDGNGTVTIGIYRKGTFYLRNSNTNGFADMVFAFGTPGDQPIAGDWDGNGTDTIGVYSPNGQFLLRNNNSAGGAQMNFFLGNAGDVGIAGDWDGDGMDTTGVFRPSSGVIFLKNMNTTGFADIALNYGLPGDQPVMGDWDNDGIDTIGIYRRGSFYLRNENTNGFAELIFALGNPGDMPIAGNWDATPMPSSASTSSSKVASIPISLSKFTSTFTANPVSISLPAAQKRPSGAAGAIALSNVSDSGTVAKYDKQEITFNLTTSASNPQLPYDPAAPSGINGSNGISVEGVFTAPSGKTWVQPGFYYQIFDDQVKDGGAWFYPTGQAVWKVRFSPDEVGTWQYIVKAQDMSGVTQTQSRSFSVTASSNHGFIQASKIDPRYFEYSDGTYFPALGMNSSYNEIQWTNPSANQDYLQKAGSNGIQVIRMWLSQWSIFGSTWNPWYGIRNDYDGYIPRAGLYTNDITSTPMSTLRMVYTDNNSGDWFEACRFIGGFQAPPAVKQNTKYHIKIRYKAQGISGPRDPAFSGFGFVAKVQNSNAGDWHTQCYNGGAPQNGVKVTGYGQDSADWTYLEGEWNSGSRNTLPMFYLALENMNSLTATANGQPWNKPPEVDIDTVAISEDLGGGNYGPNIVTKPSMEQLTYYMERNAYAFDKVLDLARQNGVYLKLVVMEKNDIIQMELSYDGKRVKSDNNNFYGNYRTMTAIRWYQQAWWRYLQARWGYSPNVFAFEAANEAEPGNANHHAQVDEMGKYLHCGVFGVALPATDGQKCNLSHPNDHMVSTSLWSTFDSGLFVNNNYPNVDYADIHQYIAKDTDLTHFQDTALSTYDLGAAYGTLASGSKKPIIRGETGLINQGANTDSLTDVSADTQGVWLHNLIWGGINPTGLIESYWYAKSHIYNTVDLRGQFKNYYTFIKDIPLNNGKYADATAVVSNVKLRVWGQKDLTNQRAHLWIANRDHVWTNHSPIPPQNGTVTLSGFSANASFDVEWWNTSTGAVASRQVVSTNSSGGLTLTVSNLSTDVAVKIMLQGSSIPPVSGTDLDTTGVFRPSNGLLYLKNSNISGFADAALNYGLPGDYPVVGDWDGDGDATIGIYRNGTFYLKNDNTNGFADIVFLFGTPGDQPIAGDWDGNGTDTIGVYRNGVFSLRNSNNAGAAEMTFQLGNAGDVGIAGDWDGDGLDTTGVFRPSNGVIFLKNMNTTGFADIALNYGLPGDQPVMGDWDNDGIDTIGIYRRGSFYLRNENTNGFAELIFALGNPGDMPIAGNWDAIP